MKYIESYTHEIFNATNRAELAEELYSTSWAKAHSDSKEEWFACAAHRVQEQHGVNVDYSSPAAFVDGLLEHRLIVEIN